MTAAMARQEGWVQLEESDMRLALNTAKMAKEGFLRAAKEETKYLHKKQCAEVQAEKKRGVEIPAHNEVKAAIQSPPAMLRQNQTSGCPAWQNGTAKDPQTRWRRTGTGAPPPDRHSERTQEPTPPLPGTPPAPWCYTSGVQSSQILNLSAGYPYSHTALADADIFDDDDTEHDTDSDPAMLTDED